MKVILSAVFLTSIFYVSAQEKLEKEIEIFANAEGPKQKLSVKEAIDLLADNSKQDSINNAEPINKNIEDVNVNEQKEYNELISSSQFETKNLSENTLNELMNKDENDRKSLLIVKNNSKCNMILRINGNNKYNIPVPAQNYNAVMVEKGDYKLVGNLCGANYLAEKDLSKNLLVSINLKKNLD